MSSGRNKGKIRQGNNLAVTYSQVVQELSETLGRSIGRSYVDLGLVEKYAGIGAPSGVFIGKTARLIRLIALTAPLYGIPLPKILERTKYRLLGEMQETSALYKAVAAFPTTNVGIPQQPRKTKTERRRDRLRKRKAARSGTSVPESSAPRKEREKPTEIFSEGEIQEFYRSYAWRKLRYKVLQAYGRKCMLYNRSDLVLHVDHIRPLRKNWHLRLKSENLQVLCEQCNHGKGSWDETDWRP